MTILYPIYIVGWMVSFWFFLEDSDEFSELLGKMIFWPLYFIKFLIISFIKVFKS